MSKARSVTASVLFSVAVLAATSWTWWATEEQPAGPVYVCFSVDHDDHCRYRTGPGIGTDPALDETAQTIAAAVARPGCLTGRCTVTPVPHTPTEDDVAASRDALLALGHPDHTIRLARATDPAPAGSVLAAVRLGDVCVLSRSTLRPGGEDTWYGPLQPDGRCLPPT